MIPQILHSSALVGCRYLVATAGPSRVFAACPDSRMLVAVASASPTMTYAGQSAVMDTEPGALASFSSAIWTVCADSTLRKFTVAATPVQSASYALACSSSAWIATYGSFLIVPGLPGGLLVVNASGVVVTRVEDVLADIAMLVSSADGYLYAFDGRGAGVVVQLNGTTGAITLGATFTATNATDIQAAVFDTNSIVLVTSTLMIVVNITARAAPIMGATTDERARQPTGIAVRSAGSYYVAGLIPTSASLFAWQEGPAIYSTGLIVGLPQVGALSFEPAPEAPSNISAPVATGTGVVGTVATVTTGVWNGEDPITYTYQWRRDGVSIPLATVSSYTFVTADAGTAVDCLVTATNGLGSTSQDSNNITAGTLPVNTVAPVASGLSQVGATLSCTNGTWTGTTPITYTYQWRRSGVAIAAATNSTYVLKIADDTTSVDCLVTATNAFGAASQDSNNLTIELIPSANLALWIRASTLGTGDGAEILFWNDESPYARQFQVGIGNGPTMQFAGQNGQKRARFLAAGRKMVLNSLANLPSAASTYYFVVDMTQPNPAQLVLSGTASAVSASRQFYVFTNDATFRRANAAGISLSGLNYGVAGIVSVVVNGASSTISENDESVTTGTVSASSEAWDACVIGAASDGTLPYDSSLYEMIFYNAVHSDATRLSLVNYFKEKYAI